MNAQDVAVFGSPASSSSWSGSRDRRSVQTFHTETAGPEWQDPAIRAGMYKYQVAWDLCQLLRCGRRGKDVINKQEIRARRAARAGLDPELYMNDGSQLPEDPHFWKARHYSLFAAWREIVPRPANEPSWRDSINPDYWWIRDWISDTLKAVDPPNASKDAVHQRQKPELPAAPLPQTRATKKRSRDSSADGADEGEAVPSKRLKRNSTSHAGLDGQANPSKRHDKKNASVTVSANLARTKRSNNKARLETSHAAPQPLRRSRRIAALHAAKAKDERAGRVYHPTTNIAVAAVGS